MEQLKTLLTSRISKIVGYGHAAGSLEAMRDANVHHTRSSKNSQDTKIQLTIHLRTLRTPRSHLEREATFD